MCGSDVFPPLRIQLTTPSLAFNFKTGDIYAKIECGSCHRQVSRQFACIHLTSQIPQVYDALSEHITRYHSDFTSSFTAGWGSLSHHLQNDWRNVPLLSLFSPRDNNITGFWCCKVKAFGISKVAFTYPWTRISWEVEQFWSPAGFLTERRTIWYHWWNDVTKAAIFDLRPTKSQSTPWHFHNILYRFKVEDLVNTFIKGVSAVPKDDGIWLVSTINWGRFGVCNVSQWEKNFARS